MVCRVVFLSFPFFFSWWWSYGHLLMSLKCRKISYEPLIVSEVALAECHAHDQTNMSNKGDGLFKKEQPFLFCAVWLSLINKPKKLSKTHQLLGVTLWTLTLFRLAVENSTQSFSYSTLTVWSACQRKETFLKLHANQYVDQYTL